MKRLMLLVMILVVGLPGASLHAQESADSQDAIEGILDTFDTYPIVALGEFHGLHELGEFYIALIQHPDFAAEVKNVVVEFGNTEHQDVIDRYVNGEDVPAEELEQVWTTTLGFGPQDMPEMYANFFAAVREVNAGLPADQRIKVWLGDLSSQMQPQLDENGLPVFPNRDVHFAQVVIDNILSQNQKALVIMGATHLMPEGFPFALPGEPGGPMMITVDPNQTPPPGLVPPSGDTALPPPPDLGQNVRQIVDEAYPDAMYAIAVHVGMREEACNAELEASLAEAHSAPSLTPIQGTWLGDLWSRTDCTELTMGAMPRYDELWADAYLYLGSVEALTMSPTEPGVERRPYLEAIAEMLAETGLAPQ